MNIQYRVIKKFAFLICTIIGIVFMFAWFSGSEVRAFVRMQNVPIEFHGKVVDENGAPLGDVDVKYKVLSGSYIFSGPKQVSFNSSVVTKSDGSFSIGRRAGMILIVGPLGKGGYRDVLSDGRSFGYGGVPQPHLPDVANPVVFLMVPEGAARLEKIDSPRLSFAWNEGSIRVPVAGLGTLVLDPVRAVEVPVLGEKFDWKIGLSVEGAQIVDCGIEFPVIAPDSGYVGNLKYEASKDDEEWPSMLRRYIAFKSDTGEYGLIELGIYVDRRNHRVNGTLNIIKNASGARNLDEP
ncbi:hypothetical protein OKA04_12130 [Luteolibacter flavescens]|uniref:Carboxypeptidase regulatory-like domain-containing protein n=1 Tax=Luteolibacter flavescens TaxID=1859460 RepID=A0ABT3FPH5_9BACT|nr:hypothetical protein [Luteolibacter flavescens]MCW1885478.1 hypothetical protein [Luteolibacter flavescens]